MTCIIWPKVLSVPRISLYTGGDAGEEEESCLVDWMTSSGNQKTKLDVIKAGHHGSHFSTPEGLLNFTTDIWVISAGAEYGHPSKLILDSLNRNLNKRLTNRPGFAVLFFLMAIAENTYSPEIKILATCPPYWLYMAPEDISRVDLNASMVLGFKDGPDKLAAALALYTKKPDIGLTWFKESAALMRTIYSLQNSKEHMAKLEARYQNNILTKVKEVDNPGSVDDLYAELIIRARAVMRLKWNLYGLPICSTTKAIKTIVVKATETGVETIPDSVIDMAQQVAQQRLTGGSSPPMVHKIWVYLLKEGSETNTASATLMNRVSDETGGSDKKIKPNIHSLQISERNKSLGNREVRVQEIVGVAEIPMLEPQTSNPQLADSNTKLYDWTMRLFIDDLRVQGNLPLTMKRFALEGHSSACLQWFRYCLGASTSVTFDGTTNQGESIDLQEIRIEFSPPSGQKTTHAFTTSYKAREWQFGSDVQDQRQNHLGFDERIQGVLFALEPSKSASSYTLREFAALIFFEISPWLLKLIGELPLVPPTVAEARSGLWFIPCYDSRTIVRLAMEPDMTHDATSKLAKILQEGLGPLQITSLVICGICIHEAMLGTKKATVTSVLTLDANVNWTSNGPPAFDGKVRLTFTKGGFKVTLKFGNSSNVLERIIEWAQEKLSASAGTLEPPKKSSDELQRLLGDFIRGNNAQGSSVQNGGINVREVSLFFSGEKRPISFACDIEVSLPCGDKRASFLVSFSWNRGTYQLSAQLWNDMTYGSIPRPLHPYQMEDKLPPDKNRVGSISIRALLQKPDLKFPEGIPDTISQARASFMYHPNFTCVSLEAAFESLPPKMPKNKSSVPPIRYVFLSYPYRAST
jgi:hypothetical protein